MNTPLDLRSADLQLVRSILAAAIPSYEVRVFGSRVAGSAKSASDLDLCIIDVPPISPGALRRLQDTFSESTLPFKVDISLYSALNDYFRRLVDASSVRLGADSRIP